MIPNASEFEQRRLGRQGLQVSPLGLGCMGMSDFYAGADEAGALATLAAARAHGVTFWDTADMYGVGANERLLARALRGVRDQIVLATKFGNQRAPDGSYLGVRGDSKYVREACEASLQRLQVEVIDLYYQHRVDDRVPIEETVGAMSRLVEEGKVRYLGLSEAGPRTIERAHATWPISAVQTEFSLWTRDPEAEVLPVCRRLGIGFVAYSPLGRGFLTGRFGRPEDLDPADVRRNHPRFQGENFQKNLDLAAHVRALAQQKGCTPAQLALAWVLGQGEDIVPIPGTTKVRHLEDNLGALPISLTPEERRAIDERLPAGAAAGARYPEAAMRVVGR